MSTAIMDLPEQEYIMPGTRTCAGCGLPIAYRFILKALGHKTIVTLPASCLTILHGIYPKTPIVVNAVNNTFASTAASASGLVAGLKVTGRDDWTVLAMAGDGGTFDMGIQALSGAAERQTDFIYVCYDNEAYMNTGVQRSLTREEHRIWGLKRQLEASAEKENPYETIGKYLHFASHADPPAGC